jgi:uncharacterized lipoprotein YddW (UPF0748 family)
MRSSLFLSVLLCGCLGFVDAAAQQPLRGVWITNVASDALTSRAKIQQTVRRCKEYGFTHLFVVVWNGGYTLYPSAVQQKYIGIKQHPAFAGRDPLREMITEAHALGLRVHAWFEFGFSYAHRDSNNRWLQMYPQWVGRNNKGALLQKNGFYWWSSLHPGPQQLLLDPYTVKLYADAHQGAEPPQDPKQKQWLQWKADQLSLYGKKLYQAVKAIRSDCMVSWAPSIYPWSKEEYLQDWPAWLEGGYADMLFPQLYRYSSAAYETILKQLQQQIPLQHRHRVYPGMLTSLGDGYQASDTLMQQFITLNRRYGFEGEVFFYYETLHRTSTPLYKQ